MDSLKFMLYLETVTLAMVITGTFYVIPLKVMITGDVGLFSFILYPFLWYMAINHNGVYRTLREKWIKRKE